MFIDLLEISITGQKQTIVIEELRKRDASRCDCQALAFRKENAVKLFEDSEFDPHWAIGYSSLIGELLHTIIMLIFEEEESAGQINVDVVGEKSVGNSGESWE